MKYSTKQISDNFVTDSSPDIDYYIVVNNKGIDVIGNAFTLEEATRTANEMNEEEKKYFDLFDRHELQPKRLAVVVSKHSFEQYTNEQLKSFLNEVNQIGFTFDFDLDLVPYGLRPINVKLNKLEGYY